MKHWLQHQYSRLLRHTAANILNISEEYVVIEYSDTGHNGKGWYAWDQEYPEDGSYHIDMFDMMRYLLGRDGSNRYNEDDDTRTHGFHRR